jgi:hypothetical protein
VSERDESEALRQQVLGAFGVKDYDIGIAPVPGWVRFWRAATFAYRRGKAIDWRSYNRAEAEARVREEEFRSAMEDYRQGVASRLSELLPDGLRFEFTTEDQER